MLGGYDRKNFSGGEMKMKRILAIALTLVLLFALAACGEKTSNTSTDGSNESNTNSNTESNTESNTNSNADGNTGGDSSAQADGFELALITDLGSIDDRSFNQGSWEGLEKYALENNITHK